LKKISLVLKASQAGLRAPWARVATYVSGSSAGPQAGLWGRAACATLPASLLRTPDAL